jgi:hypothetical protein
MPGTGSILATAGGSQLYLRDLCSTDLGTYENDLGSISSSLEQGNYFLLLSGAQDTTLQLSGVLDPGSTCDVEQPWLICSGGEACRLENGEERCLPARCLDGYDNDGDGKTDFPDEPGCTSPSDDDETDPVALPACSNGIDDDGDGAVDYPGDADCLGASANSEQPVCSNGVDDNGDGHADWPADPGCSAAGGGNEAFCGTPISGLIPSLLPAFVSDSTVGQPNHFNATCGSSASSPDRVYEWVAPANGDYVFTITDGDYDTVLHLRDLTCGGPQLACNDESAESSLSSLTVGLRASQSIAVIVDGFSAFSEGAYTLGVWKQDEAGMCTGGRDEDRDGAIDCNDSDCEADPACQVSWGGTP